MKKEDKEIFREAVMVENNKTWHLCFYKKAPQKGRKYKCTTLFVNYKIVAETTLKRFDLVQEIERGLILITTNYPDRLYSCHLCINSRKYEGIHTYIGFVKEEPQCDTEPTVRIFDTSTGKLKEKAVVLDKISSCKKLDYGLYYVTTLAGKAYFIFKRNNQVQRTG